MATTTQIAVESRAHSALALWHLTSLDAPSVAALWTWFAGRTAGIHLPLAVPAAMFLAVWILYAGDRLLDARAGASAAGLEFRHIFHLRHRRLFLAGIVAAAIAVAFLVLRFSASTTRLFALEGALLCGWFALVHLPAAPRRLPKEVAVGLFFAAATFTPASTGLAHARLALLPGAILFAALCTLNCLLIHAWEREPRAIGGTPRSRRLALSALLLAAAGTALALAHSGSPIAAACALSAVVLWFLDRTHRHMARIHLRAAADLALLTPVLLIPLLK